VYSVLSLHRDPECSRLSYKNKRRFKSDLNGGPVRTHDGPRTCPGSVALFPVLKKQDEVLALGYVVFRGALETFIYLALIITWLFLISVSKEFSAAGAAAATSIQAMGAVLLKGNDSVNTLLVFVFGLGALMLYYYSTGPT